MEEIFRQFLKEEGYYEVFIKVLQTHYRKSLSQYCKEEKISQYCVGIRMSRTVTHAEERELSVKWVRRWQETKKTILYNFVVNEGCLFQLMEALPKGKTFETLCNSPQNINTIFLGGIKKDVNNSFYWNKIHKRWRRYLRDKVFNYGYN